MTTKKARKHPVKAETVRKRKKPKLPYSEQPISDDNTDELDRLYRLLGDALEHRKWLTNTIDICRQRTSIHPEGISTLSYDEIKTLYERELRRFDNVILENKDQLWELVELLHSSSDYKFIEALERIKYFCEALGSNPKKRKLAWKEHSAALSKIELTTRVDSNSLEYAYQIVLSACWRCFNEGVMTLRETSLGLPTERPTLDASQWKDVFHGALAIGIDDEKNEGDEVGPTFIARDALAYLISVHHKTLKRWLQANNLRIGDTI
jgi:hypothetical protein